jgi:hypothetical protein
MENAGESEVSCSKTGFSCKFDWKDSRTVIGKVYKKDQHLYTITGDYTDQIQIKHLGKKVKQTFFVLITSESFSIFRCKENDSFKENCSNLGSNV